MVQLEIVLVFILLFLRVSFMVAFLGWGSFLLYVFLSDKHLRKIGQPKDWQTFIKDGMSSLIAQLTFSNHEVREMLDDPKMQKYFETESPELKTLLDLSKIAAANKVFGKWVAKKFPSLLPLSCRSINLNNALDWGLSFKRMTEANKINGNVLTAARSIQQHIDDTSLALQGCH